jgi:hypothetical protein
MDAHGAKDYQAWWANDPRMRIKKGEAAAHENAKLP